MSASLVAKLQLDIAGYQAALARSDADLSKWKDRATKNVNFVGAAHSQMAKNVGGGGGNRGLANAAMQAQDIAVQLQMGTAQSVILGQQGSQLLSVFGTGGAIAGGALAIGAAFHTVRENAVQAFQDILKESKELNANSALLVQSTNASNLAANLGKVRELTNDIQDALKKVTPNGQTGFAGHLDELKMWMLNGGNPNEQRAKLAEQQQAASEIQGRMVDKALSSSKRALDVEQLRANGREKEADALERSIKLDEELARIDAMRVQEWAKDVFKQHARDRSAADAKQAQNKEDEKASKKAEAEAKKVESAQEKLDNAKAKAAEEQMTLQERIADIQQKIATTEPEKDGKLSEIESETKKVELQAELNRLQEQQTRAIHEAAQEIDREVEAERKLALETAKATAAKQKQRNSSRELLMLDMEVLRLRDRGQNKKADNVERERRIAEAAAEFRKQGASKEFALKQAREREDIQDRLERRRNGLPARIGGVREQHRMKSGLREFNRMQEAGYNNDLSGRMKLPPGQSTYHFGNEGGSLADRAVRSAKDQDSRESRDSPAVTIGSKILDLLEKLAG